MEKKKKKRCGVISIHHYSEDVLVIVTGCRRHQTGPQNLCKDKQKHSYYSEVASQPDNNSVAVFHQDKVFSHKAALLVGRLRGCRVIKVKGSGNAMAKCPSCGSVSL